MELEELEIILKEAIVKAIIKAIEDHLTDEQISRFNFVGGDLSSDKSIKKCVKWVVEQYLKEPGII